MNIGDRIIRFVDIILDWFDRIKGYLEDASAFFEKLKDLILELVEYFNAQIDNYTDRKLATISEEHFFI
jgi:hypothetical protein